MTKTILKPSAKSTKNRPKTQKIPQFFFVLVYLLPAVLYFSYYPVIQLGANVSMNFELSLPLIWLVLFDFTSFVALIRLKSLHPKSSDMPAKTLKPPHTKASKPNVMQPKTPKSPKKRLFYPNFPGITDRRFFLLSLFPFYATLSAFWSPNPLRAILTAGIIWLLFFAVFALIYLLPLLSPPKNFRLNLLKSFFLSSALVCVFCWIQCFIDLAGASRDFSLLCLGCTYHAFGFPHPSGFAIEPQFMGNLLLAPTLTALYLLVFRYPDQKPSAIEPSSQASRATSTKSSTPHETRSNPPLILQPRVLYALAFLFSSTLFLTFSRGAIYAYAIALGVLLIIALARRFRSTFRPRFFSLIIIPVASFLFILIVQGIFTALGPAHDSFISGVTKSIHQLSLGIIDLRPSQSENPEITTDGESTSFDGYVAESTNIRLNLNGAALDTWLSAPGHPASGLDIGLRCHSFGDPCNATGPLTPTSVLFGVGLGGAGIAMSRNSFITDITNPKEIVQNQFLSLLLELGLVGIILIIFSLILIFVRLTPKAFWSSPAFPILLSLIVAYLITLNFFAGLPNALHIYLVPPLLFLIFFPAATNEEFTLI